MIIGNKDVKRIIIVANDGTLIASIDDMVLTHNTNVEIRLVEEGECVEII